MDSGSAPTGRDQVLSALSAAGRHYSHVAVMFHSAVATRLGLGATDEKMLDLLEREGPLSPGELARRTGLAPASITGVLDRLQRHDYIDRVRDPSDGRRLLVQINRARVDALAPLFDDLTRRLAQVYAQFSTDELATITRFLSAVAKQQQYATRTLSDGDLDVDDPADTTVPPHLNTTPTSRR